MGFCFLILTNTLSCFIKQFSDDCVEFSTTGPNLLQTGNNSLAIFNNLFFYTKKGMITVHIRQLTCTVDAA